MSTDLHTREDFLLLLLTVRTNLRKVSNRLLRFTKSFIFFNITGHRNQHHKTFTRDGKLSVHIKTSHMTLTHLFLKENVVPSLTTGFHTDTKGNI